MALLSRVFVEMYPKNMNTLSLLLYVALRSIGIWCKGSTHRSMCKVVEHVSEVDQTSQMFCVAADVCPVGGTPGMRCLNSIGRESWDRVLAEVLL